ncbi:WapI family immunity protein [Luteirhabdus pelagi]
MRNESETYLKIQNGSEFVKIEILKQNFPNADLDWDKDSIRCKISAKFGSFSGEFNANLMTFSFDNFKRELIYLYENLEQSATFKGYEDQVKIFIQGDGIGHLDLFCDLKDNVGMGNELKGELNLDQTYLPDLIEQLDTITSEYKVHMKMNG